MKSDISKFLVKSVLSTASVATLIPVGTINGMERQEQQSEECTVCLYPLEGNVYKLQCHTKVTHNFHRDCIKKWIEREQKCPICKRTLSEDEQDAINNISHIIRLENYQNKVVNRWNTDAKNVYDRGGYHDSSKDEMCYPKLIRTEYTDKFEYKPAFESENDFINADLGMCYKCSYIFDKRPKICNVEEVARTRSRDVRQKFAECIEKCPCCRQENINLKGVKPTRLYTYNNSPKASLFDAHLLFTLAKI